MLCGYCNEKCTKAGKQANQTQKYYCKPCKKYQQAIYKYKACTQGINTLIVKCIKNSVGIRGISRIIDISVATVINRIKAVAATIIPPKILSPLQSYEVDEMWTFVGNKKQECWVMYAINRQTKEPVALQVGRRNSINLGNVINRLLVNHPLKIYTDRLAIYKKLIPKVLHSVKHRSTNYIERMNLTLRTHLKRLSRRTIGYSRCRQMLRYCLLILFWG